MNLSRIILVVSFFFILSFNRAYAQVEQEVVDTVAAANTYTRKFVKDPAFLARQKFVTDSIMTHSWLFPDSMINKHMIMDSIIKANVEGRSNLLSRYKELTTMKVSKYRLGKPVPKGALWVPAVVALLLVLFAVLKISFNKQLQTIVQSFFSNRVLNNLNKEDNLFTSWPFLLLFVQFGFTIGMFFYLVSGFYHISFPGTGFQFYLSISILIVVLYIMKIVLLRILGHLFNIQKPVNEYVTILYLSYFNLSLIFIPLVVAFALSPLKYGPYYIAISFILLGVIFAFQFIRAGVNILSHHRFSKVYLFLYFCALEICPILILIKAIGL
ncbi:DUF4271 domain-containing protein [Pedobacter foliorum]|uniref:DUF4271 domain-containing protein n=1 Tax=Pedobacter foliorum TaxID=2739058 RepID=UPI0015633388|nr:DUF4271 domain-containing protein [Pedobacter foliorum]NRF38825.1 DUF4271 domain-containing protein [Pedobacter foliorum]